MRSDLRLLSLLAAPLIAAVPARAAVFGAPAVPITQTIDIQPIDVCNNTGQTCASVGLLNAYVAYADLMFQQAGVAFVALPTTKFIPAANDPTNWLNPTVSATGSDPFDIAHQLMNGPRHGEPAGNSTAVLNVWFVNTITVSGPAAYGSGLIDGNGSIIATAPNPQTHLIASIDTLAHELGHNLGLTHVDQAPLNTTPLFTPANLMYSGDEPGDNPLFRTVPVELCQVAPYNCAAPQGATVAAQPIKATVTRGGRVLTLASTAGIVPSMFVTGANIPAGDYVVAVSGSTVTLAQSLTAIDNVGTPVSFAAPPPADELSSTPVAGQPKSQIATANNPLYTMQLADIAITPAKLAPLPGCAAGLAVHSCGFTLSGTLPPGISLTGYSLRFLGRTDVTGSATALCGAGPAQNSVGVRTVTGGNEELAFALAACSNTVTDAIALSYVNPFTLPISADYDFSNGVASRAGFDHSGDSDSQDPLSVSSAGAPQFPPDTGLPISNLADASPEGQTPEQVASFPLPNPSFPVPEPPASLVFVSGLGLLLLTRGRGRSRG